MIKKIILTSAFALLSFTAIHAGTYVDLKLGNTTLNDTQSQVIGITLGLSHFGFDIGLSADRISKGNNAIIFAGVKASKAFTLVPLVWNYAPYITVGTIGESNAYFSSYEYGITFNFTILPKFNLGAGIANRTSANNAYTGSSVYGVLRVDL